MQIKGQSMIKIRRKIIIVINNQMQMKLQGSES